jgi:hypothetical protein
MNLSEAKGKAEVTGELGESIDESLEHARNSANQAAGAKQALRHSAKAARILHAHIDKDLEEGKVPTTGELETAAYAKAYVTKAIEAMLNLADKFQSDELIENGKAVALKEALEKIDGQHKVAVNRGLQLIAEAQEAEQEAEKPKGKKRARKLDGRPSLVERRRAGKAAKAAAAKGKSNGSA